MKKIFIITMFMCLSGMSIFPQTCEWAEKIGGNFVTESYSIATNKMGDIFVSGHFDSFISFNNGISLRTANITHFIAKYDKTGICQWAEKVADSDSNSPVYIAADDSGNVYIAGSFNFSHTSLNNRIALKGCGMWDVYIAKYDQTGLCQWAETIGGGYEDMAKSIVLDNQGNIIIAGNFSSKPLEFNNNFSLNNTSTFGSDIFIAQYNNSGVCQWAKSIGGKSDEEINSISINQNSEIYIAGSYNSSTINFNNGKSLNNSGKTNGFVAKYSKEGICIWAENIGGIGDNDEENSKSIAVDKNGDINIVGEFTSTQIKLSEGKILTNKGGKDIYFAKYNAFQQYLWSEQIAGNKNDIVFSAVTDAASNVYIVGSFNSDTLYFNNGKYLINFGHEDGFIAKYNKNGLCQWVEQIKGQSFELVDNITVDSSYNIFVTGIYISDTLKFNNNRYLLNNNLKGVTENSFIAKYSQNNTSISEEAISNTISVYPNPATDYIEIKPSEDWQPSEGSSIQIFDMMGTVVAAIHPMSDLNRMNIEQLLPGMYFIKIGNRVEKFVKM